MFQTPERDFMNSCETAQHSLKHFEEDLNALANNENLIAQIANNTLSTAELKELIEKDFYFYLFKNDSIIFWSDNGSLPELSIKSISEDGELIVNKNGYYLGFQRRLSDYTLIGMQLLKPNFPIVNNYLKNEFSSKYPFDNKVLIQAPSDSSQCVLRNLDQKSVCSFTNPKGLTSTISSNGVVAGLISVISFWLLTWMLIVYFNKYYSFWTSYLILFVASFLFLELIGFVSFEFKKNILFSPELYASQYFGPSLGHLFFNALIVFFINLLMGAQYYLNKWRLSSKKFLIFSAWLLIQIVLFHEVVRSLILDSIISFEINNFTLTTPYTLLGLAIISILSFGLFVSLYIWLFSLKDNHPINKYYILIGFFILVAIVMSVFSFVLIAWLVPLILLLHCSLFFVLVSKAKYANRFSYLINVLFFAALIIASILIYYNLKNEDYRKEIAANNLSENRDLITEYQFEEIQKEIKNDPFFRKFFISPFVSQKELQQRLDYLYFGGYLSKYNVSSTAFNLEGKPIKTNKITKLSYYYNLINQQAEDSYSEWLFLVPQIDGKSSYLSILPIQNDGKVSGTLVLELSPKTYTKENLYPELLIEKKLSPIAQLQNTKDYEYAIYKNSYLVNQAGEYPFPYFYGSFEAADKLPFVIIDGEFRLNFFQIDEETTAVISDKRSSLLIPISTFSYVFIFLSIATILIFMCLYFLSRQFKVPIIKPLRFTFKNKINISIALITVASFIFIGIVTISYFSELYRVNNTDKLIKKQQSVLSSLEYYMAREVQSVQDGLPANLATEIASMAEIQGIDINMFNLDGSLLHSSQPGVFGNGLISKKIHPLALHHLLNLREERFIQEEVIGSLNFQSIYVPVRLSNGKAIAILNLPYFAQEETLRKELSDLMVALINVYVLLLMISIFVAFLISTSITRPLANISEKIGLVKFDSKNEQIEWNSEDEIGALVKEYNKMILQIEESANALAQSERESAWREMARQIAHEIKNPLTPMKLGIQHLQRTIIQDPDRVNELAEKVSKTMIEQIENLSEIATAFSSFAKMPAANKEKVNLVEILQNVVNLFNQTSKTSILLSTPEKSAMVYADKNQLLSVFNNLIKNAQQATEDVENPLVEVQLISKDGQHEVRVIDNGVGIPEDKTHKVFVPNFTTKSSGTGLGLAISKQIVENSHGKIWFESKENNGSTFFVTLPKYHKPV